MEELDKLNVKRGSEIPRTYRRGLTRAVTPIMLVRSLKTLRDSNFIGVYFSPMQVAQMIADIYPQVEQDFPLLLQEVKDKLICAAGADIIGFKFDRGYHALTDKGCSARIDTRSKLMFWLLYKKMMDEKGHPRKPGPKLFRSTRSS